MSYRNHDPRCGAGRQPRVSGRYVLIAASVFLLSAAPIIGMAWGAVQSPAQTADPEAQVRARISAYWEAMQREDYRGAAQYVHPESRDVFEYKVPKSRIERWTIQTLQFNENRTACDATILVSKPVAIFASNIVDWPLKNQWVLFEGDWYFKLPWDKKRNPALEMFRAQQDTSVKTTEIREAKPNAAAPSGERIASAYAFAPDPANPAVVHNGQKSVFRYHYTNKKSTPTRIVSVHADCHCTSVKEEYPDIAPGAQGTVEVTLDTFGLPIGPIEKQVHVTFADQADPQLIRISVKNQPNFAILPSRVDFGVVPRGKPAAVSFRIVNQSGQAVKLLSHLKSDPKLAVNLDKSALAPGEAANVTLSYDASVAGEFLDSLMLQTDLAADPLITVSVRGQVGP